MNKKSKGRTLILSQRVDSKIVGELITKIYNINQSDDVNEKDLKKFKRKPINLILSTGGGLVRPGLGLIGAIELSKTPIHTTVLGHGMSMGLHILVAGDRRFMHRQATLMYHELSAGTFGKAEDMKEDVDEFKRLNKVLDDHLTKNTKVTKKMLNNYKKRKAEWYITPKDALELGIIHEII